MDLTGQNLGGMTLIPGTYHFDSSAMLTGVVVLDAQGDANARFNFQMTTASSSTVLLVGMAQIGNINWAVGSSATLGTSSLFSGSILAMTSVSATTGAVIKGNLLARNGAVTLDSNQINAVPEPASLSALGLGVVALARTRRRK